MVWTIEYSAGVAKTLGKIDRQAARRILKAVEEIAALDDPRLRGKALTGELSGLWRYRVGDYRVIAKIEDGRLVIVVVALGHRRDVYRR